MQSSLRSELISSGRIGEKRRLIHEDDGDRCHRGPVAFKNLGNIFGKGA